MTGKRQCRHCHRFFTLRAQNPAQQYCSESVCQKARKRSWQKRKLQTDAAYRENQRDANRRWREQNPDYQREYRQRNQEYAEENRRQQKKRNHRAREKSHAPIVKMDASPDKISINPGRYELRLIEDGIVKMDASIIEISVLSASCL